MPELPEVETTRRGIAPHLEGHRVTRVVVRERRLRWPIPEDLDVRLSGQRIEHVGRRAKYLLIEAECGTLIGHLGMSGSLRLVEAGLPAGKHEHVDIELDSGMALRYTDPGRFGALLWSQAPLEHELLRKLEANVYLIKNPNEACRAKWTPGAKTLTPAESMVGKVNEALNAE